MAKRSPMGSFEFVFVHRLDIPQLSEILDAFNVPSGAWKEEIMAQIKSVRTALNRLRKGLDKLAVDEAERKRLAAEEVVEDAEAEAYRLRSEADIANLKAEIAELKARKTLTEAEESELAEMVEELAQKTGLPPEESTDPAPPVDEDEETTDPAPDPDEDEETDPETDPAS